MTSYVFADESGTSRESPCYSIGAITIPATSLESFNKKFYDLRQSHGVIDELKWNRIGKGHGAINFVLAWVDLILRSRTLAFDVIVVNKSLYRNWHGSSADKERAFYQTYTQLLHNRARQSSEQFEIYIDNRSDSYEHHDEVVEIITNRMLARLHSDARLHHVTKADSKLLPGIQVADVLTGAINAGHRLHLDPKLELRLGKRILLDRFATMLGWNALCFDTMPNSKFNIWHFPIEYRAVPKTAQVKAIKTVPYITPDELRE
jgi:hypothetical protein